MAQVVTLKDFAASVTDVERFMSKIEFFDSKDCWNWRGTLLKCTNGNYGRFGVRKAPKRRTAFLAHRASFYLANGEFDSQLQVLHKCDNPSCVNPEHLFLGTHADNMRDMSNKERSFGQKKTHCPQGHAYQGYNVIKVGKNGRMCRKCNSIREKQRGPRKRRR